MGDILRIGATIFSGGVAVNTALGSSWRISPVVPKSNFSFATIDAGEFDGNPNQEPSRILDGGEL